MNFLTIYLEELEKAVKNYPQEYLYGIQQVPSVYERMKSAFIKGSYNKDSRAIKATCKRLGIKHTYEAINKALKGESNETNI